MLQVLMTELTGEYAFGYRDQNAFVYLLKKKAADYLPRVAFVNKDDYCFQCYWTDLVPVQPLYVFKWCGAVPLRNPCQGMRNAAANAVDGRRGRALAVLDKPQAALHSALYGLPVL